MSWQQYPQQPLVPYTAQPVILTDQEQPSTAVVVIAWVLTVFTGLYLLPWAIAATRGKSDQAIILLINVLLGWTVIGWIAALIMSVLSHRQIGVVTGAVPAAITAGLPPAGWYPNPSGPGQRYWDGVAWTGHFA